MKTEISHNYSIIKRISSLVLIVLCVLIAVNLYLMHNRNAASWYAVESEQLGRSLTVQAAQLVAGPLAQNDETLLAHYVEVINQGSFVQAAVLFDADGLRFAQQEDRKSILTLTIENEVEPLVFVEDVIFEDEIIGYIKLVFNRQEITQHHRKFNQNQISQSILIIVLSIIAATLATRLFYKIRDNYRYNSGL